MGLKISRILHAGYVIECDRTQITFDPIFENPFSRNCYAFPNVRFDQDQIRSLKFSAVFISHYHDDHCSLESLNLLDRETPIYIFCVFEEMLSIIRELGFCNVHSLTLDQPVQIGAIQVIPRRALDEDVDSIFEIHAAGVKVLNVIDSWIGPSTLDQLIQSAPWDLILWPFQTMREIEVLAPTRIEVAPPEVPPEWIEQLQLLKPKYVVPSSCQFQMESWSWYNHAFFPITYKQFGEEVQDALPAARIIRMNPSVSYLLSEGPLEEAVPLSWVEPLGNQEVDYSFDRNLKAPPTSQIAQHFEALFREQTQGVIEYCLHDLVKKYQELDSPEDLYFHRSRHWRLSLYDHRGEVQHFYYEIHKDKMQRIEASEQLGWTTEVPISRLYGALEQGESLTSMYMRINDFLFDPQTENEVQSADIMEDPLIRCLFTGVFGAYQAAQLKRIQNRSSVSGFGR